MPEEAKRAPPAPVWNQSFPSPKALFVRGTFFIRCYPLVHSRGSSPIRNLGTRVAAVVPQLASGTASGTATATDTTRGHKALVAVVCPSVCPVPDPWSSMEELSKLKVGRNVHHDMDDPKP